MKITITRICGHEETVALFGPQSDRDRKIEWMKESLCSECYKIKQASKREAERAAELDAAKLSASEDMLPELTGSEKQVNWAFSIRAKLMEGIKYIEEKTAEALANGSATKEQAERVFSVVSSIKAQSEAKYWIDNRDNNARTLVIKESKNE